MKRAIRKKSPPPPPPEPTVPPIPDLSSPHTTLRQIQDSGWQVQVTTNNRFYFRNTITQKVVDMPDWVQTMIESARDTARKTVQDRIKAELGI